MLIFIKQRGDSFLPTRISQGPRFQHTVRMNNVGSAGPLMPALRTDRAIFPQTVDGQNVEISADYRRYKLA